MREEKRGSRSSRIVERNSGNSVMTPKDLCYTSFLVITNFCLFKKYKLCAFLVLLCVGFMSKGVLRQYCEGDFCEVSPFEVHGDLIVLNLVLGSLQFWQSSIKTYFVIVFFVNCCLYKPGLLSSFLMVLVSHIKHAHKYNINSCNAWIQDQKKYIMETSTWHHPCLVLMLWFEIL
jgi:hypothetical protein